MSKKKKEPQPAAPVKHAVTVPCHLKSVNLPDNEKATIGISIKRADMTLEQADELLCGAQLSVRLQLGDVNQLLLIPDVDTLDLTAEVKGYGVGVKSFGATLRLHRDGTDAIQLARFAAQDGIFSATRTGSIKGKSAAAEGDESEEEDDGDETGEMFEGDEDKEEADVRPPVLHEQEQERKREKK